jgi:alpha-beta hydrolase superfamily lysophospholipase
LWSVIERFVTTREPFAVACADGWVLAGEVVVGAPPVAVAVVGHAMMVDRRTLDRPRGRGLVSTLAARGIACVVADLRGHGTSGPRAGEGGDWGYDDLVEHDVPTLIAFARARFPSLPLACVGHSLFGHVALAHLARHSDADIDGLVLLAVNVANPSWDARSVGALQRRAAIELMGILGRIFGRLPVRRFGYGSDDEAAARRLRLLGGAGVRRSADPRHRRRRRSLHVSAVGRARHRRTRARRALPRRRTRRRAALRRRLARSHGARARRARAASLGSDGRVHPVHPPLADAMSAESASRSASNAVSGAPPFTLRSTCRPHDVSCGSP